MQRYKNSYDIAIIGGGIVGSAMAYMASMSGWKVAIFEKNAQPIGASIRNFGLLWPIGQGENNFALALNSQRHWKNLAIQAGFWLTHSGSIHLAYHQDEMDVLDEFYQLSKNDHQLVMLRQKDVLSKSDIVNPRNLKGGLFSAEECNVNPREALYKIHAFLIDKLGVDIYYNTQIQDITYPYVSSFEGEWQASHIYICTGSEFTTLYPNFYERSGLIKCKLQMMRTCSQGKEWTLGPSLCAGLTLQHYQSFKKCKSLELLKQRYEQEMGEFLEKGIHVLVSQGPNGSLLIGDTHEYGIEFDPFISTYSNQLVLKYLKTFTHIPIPHIEEYWTGEYAIKKGKQQFSYEITDRISAINGVGGAGMTLSFGVAEQIIAKDLGANNKKRYHFSSH